ncbi:hypothetical protein [Mycobacterium sp. 1274756.6]|uniref:DUF7159 family protein n=1 Tax=Mycobacterium sp. 1274756.6 TaxID=1834076 RepID=UPI0007FE6484|nr:hypothetical protein [Mycobacterium sp. 1274756.6]OBJ71012.1 hypothetical protein A5643_08985 [Mycobacterium sp. 1274756.6]
MDLVLGVALTGGQARWVAVDGTGAGATLDHGVVDVDGTDAPDALAALDALAERAQWRAIGLTWSEDAAGLAGEAQQVLARRAAVTALSHSEAIGLLAAAIADVAGYDFLAVCNVEADAAAVASINAQRITIEPVDGPDPETRAEQVAEEVRRIRPRPDVVFVLGADDAEALAARLRQVTTQPVLSAAEGEFALPRGAALAAARAATEPTVAPDPARRSRRVPALAGAAAVLLVVAVAVGAVGRSSSRTEEPPPSQAGQQTVRPPAPPPAPSPTAEPAPLAAPGNGAPEAPLVVPESPLAPPEQASVPEAPPVEAPPVEAPVEAPPAAPPPAEPPPAAEPVPEPVFVPPPPPPPPPPRLRDRILDKIPGIDRFR